MGRSTRSQKVSRARIASRPKFKSLWNWWRFLGQASERRSPRRMMLEQLEVRELLSIQPLLPSGSLIYQESQSRQFTGPLETHSFSLDLDPNQTLGAVITPGEAGLQTRVMVTGPGSLSIGPIVATQPGEPVIIHAIPISEAGTYSIEVTNVEGTGNYDLNLVLNAELEAESNDALDQAQNIDASYLALDDSTGRAAVVGSLADQGTDVDWYAFSLSAGQIISLVLNSANQDGSSLKFYDPAGEWLAVGLPYSAGNMFQQRITSYECPAAGTYYAAVEGRGQYTLVIVSGADMEVEPNGFATNAQDITLTGAALGLLGQQGDVLAVEAEPNNSVATANDLMGSFLPVASNQYQAVVTGTIAAGNNQDWDYFRIYVSQGDALRIDLEGAPTSKGSLLDPYLLFFSGAGVQLTGDDDSGTGLNSRLDWSSFPWATGDYYVVADSYGAYTGSYTLTVTLTTPSFVSAVDSADQYLIHTNAGDNLIITTSTPGDGPGEPGNDLDPLLELYDPTGTLVASNNNWAVEDGGDGRNARIEYTIPDGAEGVYRIRVSSVIGEGAYLLQIGGATGSGAADLSVVSASIPDGLMTVTYPETILLDFNRPLLLTSVEPSDLTVNGVPADSVTVIDGDTLRFGIAGTGAGDGLYTVELAAGVLQTLAGVANAPFSLSFTLDSTSPVVTWSSASYNAVIEPGDATFVFEFSEPLNTQGLGSEDVVLREQVLGRQFTPSNLAYDSETRRLSLSYQNLPDGCYSLRLISGANAFRDLLDNCLNGAPSDPLPTGTGDPAPDDFVFQFFVDASGDYSIALPLRFNHPLGGLIFDQTFQGTIGPAGDADGFGISLDRNQTLTVLATCSGGLIGAVELRDQVDNVLAAASAEYPNQEIVLQSVPIPTSGQYRIVVRGLQETTGGFTGRLILNAAVEQEEHGGPGNDSYETAEDLAPYVVHLADGIDRWAVVGSNPTDFYATSLSIGDRVAAVLATQSGQQVALRLFNSDGVPLALGQGGYLNLSQVINQFLVPEDGIYYWEISGIGTYSFVVTRGATFDLEPDEEPLPAKDLTLVGAALGMLKEGGEIITTELEPNGQITTANDLTGSFYNIAPGQYRAVVTGTISAGSDADWDFFRIRVSQGDALRIDLEGVPTNKGTLGDPYLRFFNSAGSQLTSDDDNGEGLNSLLNWSSFPWASGDYFVVADSYGSHTGTYTLTVTITSTKPFFIVDPADQYLVQLNDGDVVEITTVTPGDEAYEPPNDLNLALELYDPSGVLVAENQDWPVEEGGDGRNARIIYVVPEGGGGTYRVRIVNQSGMGAYILKVQGATGQRPLRVLTTQPTDALPLVSLPVAYRVRFSENILLNSIEASDLQIVRPDGVEITPSGFTAIDGQTIDFVWPSDIPQDGIYTLRMPEGALLATSGASLAAFATTLTLDTTPPVVVSTSLAEGQVIDTGPLTVEFVFSEPIATSGLGPEDVTLVETVSGTTLNPVVVTFDKNTRTLTAVFDNIPEGDLTLTLLSGATAIRDVAGNLLDGNADGVAGDPFLLHFSAGAGILPFAVPLKALGPDGSLIHEGFQTGYFNSPNDEDVFSINLESGQTVTLLLVPEDASIVASLEFISSTGPSLGSVAAVVGGQPIYLQTLPVSSTGIHQIRATNSVGIGRYTIRCLVNAAIGEEVYSGVANDTLAQAQDLEGAVLSLGDGANRTAVVGELTGDGDMFAFDLSEGERASLTVWSHTGETLNLELWDASGRRLTLGKAVSSLGCDNSIPRFIAPANGRYYVRVTGPTGARYSLVVVRNAELDIADNDGLDQAIWLWPNATVLGGLAQNRLPTIDFLDSDGNLSLEGFTATGLWHVTDSTAFGGQLPGHSQAAFAYFGSSQTGDYNFGYVNGALVSPVFRVATQDPVLRFRYRLFTETQYANSRDRAEVYVERGDGTSIKVAQKGSADGLPAMMHTSEWTPLAVDLSPFVGEDIRIRFWFDSTDAWYNQYLGWQIDDIQLPRVDEEDFYRVRAEAGATLRIETFTPFDGDGEPENLLDPVIELYDNSGRLLAEDNNGADDGRNALVSYSVTTTGDYFVRVRQATAEPGNYLLRITGAAAEPEIFAVAVSDPPDGATLGTFPNRYRLTFTQPVLLTSVDQNDLNVNGLPAESFLVIDANTVEFVISSASGGDGWYRIEIAPGAILSTSGQSLAGFSTVFEYDSTGPTVIASSVQPGETYAPGSLLCHFQFSEALATDGLGVEDVLLVEQISGATFPANSLTFDALTKTASVSFDNLPEGNYRLSLLSSATGFRDRVGNLLDGNPSFPLPSGDGIAGDPFVVEFQLDRTVAAFPVPLSPLMPLGSLLYSGSLTGVCNASGDQDIFTIALDAGQTLSGVLSPLGSDLQGRLSVIGPDGGTLGTVEAVAPGESILLNELPISSAGLYQVVVQSVAGAGAFRLQLLLNAAVEREWAGGSDNDSSLSAQALVSGWLDLGNGSQRAAVLGRGDGPSTADFYRMDLVAGEQVSWFVTGLAENNLAIQILDASQTVLACGISETVGTATSVSGFVVPADGVYYVRVVGSGDYSLLALRNIDFESRQLVYFTDFEQGAGAEWSVRETDNSVAAFTRFLGRFSSGDAALTLNTQPGQGYLLQFDVMVIDSWDGSASPGPDFFNVDIDGIQVFHHTFNQFGGPQTYPGTPSLGGQNFGWADWNDAIYRTISIPFVASSDRTIIRFYDGGLQGLHDESWGIDNVAILTQDISLTNRVLGYYQGNVDLYYFVAQAGDRLVIHTTTPGDGPGEPSEILDPYLQLYGPAGILLALDDDSGPQNDNRNAAIVYTVPEGGGGFYTVRLQGVGQGPYTITVTGATGAVLPPLEVIGTVPSEGQRLAAAPTALDLVFSHGLRVDTLDVGDLVVDGGATVTGLEVVDGRTVRYHLAVPDLAGVYTYSLAAGGVMNLQGTTNIAYQGTFVVDRTGPRVVGQIPTVQTSAPFSQWTFLFDEPINPASFTVADITQFLGPGGTNLLSQITGVSVVGHEVTVTFQPQAAQGIYIIRIGPNVEDTVGNRMDQNGNGIAGETSDFYVGTLDLQSADLAVVAVTLPENAVFGSPVTFEWTVRNIGSDPAREGWRDQAWLSTDPNLDSADIPLFAPAVAPPTGAVPLEAGATYSQIATAVLPLSNSLNSGTYYIIVKTDANSQQPENNENNNTRRETLAITLPPLPDLIVSHIDAPIEAFSGQTIQYSWTVTNQGNAAAAGTWRDRVLLSSDQNAGNDILLGDFSFTGILEVGESVTRRQSFALPISLEGDYWFILQTDVGNQVFEHAQDANNTSVSPVPMTVRLSPLPNLQVASVIAPDAAFSSQQVAIEWIVTNAGTGSTSAPIWYDRVWLSSDAVLDAGDTLLGSASNTSYLNAGDSYRNSLTATLPRGIQGDFWFIVQTDADNHVYEHNRENDNVGVGAKTHIFLTPPPDLRILNIQGPDQAFSNQSITVRWTVLNDDTTPGAGGRTVETGWFDTVFLSSSATQLENTIALGSVWHSGILQAGESYQESLTARIPVNIEGDWYIFVRTDSSNHVFEHIFEENNLNLRRDEALQPRATRIILTPPDLEVDFIEAPTNGQASYPFSFTYRVTNYGVAATPNSWWIDAHYLSTDTILDDGDLLLGRLTHYGALDIFGSDNASYTQTVTYTIPNGLSGDCYILVKTDATNVVFEGFSHSPGENNNVGVSSAPMRVVSNPPDLIIIPGSFQPDAMAQAGSFLRATWGVKNQGSGATVGGTWTCKVYASMDNVLGGNDDRLLATFVRTGNLAAGDFYYARDKLVNIPIDLSGVIYLYVRTDADNQVYEGSLENNNDSELVPVTIVQNLADLQVSSIAPISGPIRAGDWITVEWTVVNLGTGPTNALSWRDRIYLSPDPVLGNGNDIHLGSATRTSPLVASGSYSASATVQIPTNVSGAFYVGVWTDADQQVFEGAREDNNTRLRGLGTDPGDPQDPGPILPPRPGVVLVPDLVLVSVDAPTEAYSGQTFEVTWTVRNDGDPTPRDWFDQVYLSLDQVFDPTADISLGHVTHAALDRGASYTKTQSFRVPRGLSGPFYVFVVTDRGNRLDELNELNNVGYDRLSMMVQLLPPADLVVGTINIPANGIPGANATITYSVRNDGTEDARGSWYDSVYISSDPTWDIDDAFFGRVYHEGDVSGLGGSYSHTLTAPLPGVVPGQYYVLVRTDILNHIPESQEGNNIGASLEQIIIDVEQLELGQTRSGRLAAGRAVYYRIDDLTAGETIRVRFSGAEHAFSELYIRRGEIPTRSQFDFAAHQPFLSNQEIILPVEQSGVHYVMVYTTAAGGPFDYTISADVVPFSILAVHTNRVGNADYATVKISGARFRPNTTFFILDQDMNSWSASQNYVQDSATAFVTFDLYGMTPGLYSLAAYDPDLDVLAFFEDSITIIEGAGYHLQTLGNGPAVAAPNRIYRFEVHFGNDGDGDAMAPLLLVTSFTNTPLGFSPDSLVAGVPLQILGTPDEGPLDILRPGSLNSVSVYLRTGTAAQGVELQVEPFAHDDSTLISAQEWEQIRLSVKPVSVSEENWNAFWANVPARIGPTWGDYVRFLNRVVKELSVPGHPLRDVRSIFEMLYRSNPSYLPSVMIRGTLVHAANLNPLSNVELIAIREEPDGSMTFGASTFTDANGAFVLSGLTAGKYELVLGGKMVDSGDTYDYQGEFIGFSFDMDRDALADEEYVRLTLAGTSDHNGLTLYGIETPEETPVVEDRVPLLAQDSAGRLHMVWQRDGQFWHAVNSGLGWEDAQPIPDVPAGEAQFLIDPHLINGESEGLLLAWVEGQGNDAEVRFVVGRRTEVGTYLWTAPAAVTANPYGDGPFVVATHADGQPVYLIQRQDHSILDATGFSIDDPDIYSVRVPIIDPVFSAQLLSSDDLLALQSGDFIEGDSGLLLPASTNHRIRFAWKHGNDWRILKHLSEVRIDLQGQRSCSLILKGNGALKGDISFKLFKNDVKLEVEVKGGADLRFAVPRYNSPSECHYEFEEGRINIAGNVGVNFPATWIPWVGPLLTAAGIQCRGEAGANLALIWEAKNGKGFPRLWDKAEGKFRLGGGLNKEFEFKTPVRIGRIELPHAKIVARVLINFHFKVQSPLFGIAKPPVTVSGLLRAAWDWWPGRQGFVEYTVTWPGTEVSPTAFGDQQLSTLSDDDEFVFQITSDSNRGTLNDYSAPGEQRITHNLFREGPPLIAKAPSGNLLAAWIGPEGIMVSEYNPIQAAWGQPSVIPGTDDHNYGLQDLALAFDGQGNVIAIWSAMDISSLGPESTSEEIRAAFETGGDLMFARWDQSSGTWSTPTVLAASPGAEGHVRVQRLSTGQILATWLVPADENGASVLRAAFWNPADATWSLPVDLVTETIIDAPSIGEINGHPILVWTAGVVSEGTTRYVLRSTTLEETNWVPPQDVTIALASSSVSSISTTTDSSTELTPALFTSRFPFIDPPEECCKCKEWEKIENKIVVTNPKDCGVDYKVDVKKCKEYFTYKICLPPPVDPNEIVGPIGQGDERWIPADQPLDYVIRFENDPTLAQAPAQRVVITQQLDSDLDWRTFRLGDFGFAGLLVTVPANQSFYSTRIDLRAERGYFVDVTAGVDIQTGQVFWTFVTIDPATGEQPLDPNIGFLAINNEQGDGEGWVSYSIRAKQSARTGDRIDAQARIVFDTEPPIDTPPVFNTIDAGKPQSSILTLPATTDDSSFLVSWTGSDDVGGSGLTSFHVLVSENDGPFTLWLQNTRLTSALFQGRPATRYAFYTVAIDVAGNMENIPSDPDAMTVTPGAIALLGDRVWSDLNANGRQDEGEPGMVGIPVRLFVLGATEPMAETITDENGLYQFSDLDISLPYVLEFVVPAGYGFTRPNVGADDALDSDVMMDTGRTGVIRLLNGANLQWDAGVVTFASLSGFVWRDDNGNGQREEEEPFLSNQVVYLDLNRNGEKDAGDTEAITDEQGRYSFSELLPGSYVVRCVVPAYWEQTYPGASGANGLSYTGADVELVIPELGVPTAAEVTLGCQPAAHLIGLDVLRTDSAFAGLDGHGLAVVIIDTGITPDHPFFGPDADGNGVADRIVFQYDFADNDPIALDLRGHGTHVTSVIASQDQAYPGVAPAVSIIHLKVFSDQGSGSFGYLEKALQWVIRNVETFNIVAVNLSLGDGQNWPQPVGLYGVADELRTLDSLGVITVAAAGNGYLVHGGQEGLAYPAADPHTISVGAVWDSDRGPQTFGIYGTDFATAADRIASFSQRDQDNLDALAPGAVILAASSDGTVTGLRGTSMAAAYVTGAAVLAQQVAIQEHGVRLSSDQFRDLLRSSGVMVVDGDDEQDNVPNTGHTFFRLNLPSLIGAVKDLDAIVWPGGSAPGSGQGGAVPIDLLNGWFAYTIQLDQGQHREDVNFGLRPLDVESPTSAVEPLPPEVLNPTFLVRWSGSDGDTGSGIVGYDVYVSEDGGDFVIWLQNTDLTESSFTGWWGRSYAFYSQARDAAGNLESPPAAPDAWTVVRLPPAENLGNVDFTEVENLVPENGVHWVSFTAAHTGVLTLLTSASDISLQLYDSTLSLLGESLSTTDGQRLDFCSVQQTELYYVCVMGPESPINLRIVNLVSALTADTIVLWQTGGDDFVRIDFSGGRSVALNINGVDYGLTLEGANPRLELSPEQLSGQNTLIVNDSHFDDTVHLGRQSIEADFGGINLVGQGYQTVHVYARNGGLDVAYLTDIALGFAGNDNTGEIAAKFRWEPQYHHAKMLGLGMYNRVKFFDRVYAEGHGNNDSALILDSPGDDVFTGRKNLSSMQDTAGTYYVEALGFRTVRARSTAGGFDVAHFFDSKRKDEFHFKSHKSLLFDRGTNGADYFIEARLFDQVFATARSDARGDIAKVWDTPADEYALAEGIEFRVFKGSALGKLLLYLSHFEQVKVRDSSGGTDRKEIRDPVLYDVLFGNGWL